MSAGVWSDVRRNGRGLVAGALGMALGLAAVVFFGGLGLGVREGVLKRALTQLPAGTVEIRPRGGVPVGFLRFEGSRALMRPLDGEVVRQLSSMEGVQAVYPRVAAMFPMRAQGGKALLGRDVYTDLFASGTDAAFFKDDLPDPAAFQDHPNGVVPAVVSRRLLELFNRVVAPSLGVPGLTEETVVGFAFTLVLGESYAAGINGGGTRVAVQVVGVSDRAMLLGISVPRATVERWNAAHAAQPPQGFAGAYVVTHDATELPSIIKQAEGMGFVVEQSAQVAGGMVAALVLSWLLVAALILLVAAFNVAQTLGARVQARRREIGLMRAVGARRGHVQAMVLREALVMAAAACLLGMGAGVGAAALADELAVRWLPRFPFQPDSFFMFPWWLCALAALATVLSALAGALPPARAAAKVDPVRALEG